MQQSPAKGKVQVQAQSDAMELTADKDLTITSVKGSVQIAASQEVLLASGGGYIRIAGGNIEVHCPGEVSIKGTSHSLSGPTNLVSAFKQEGRKADLHIRYEDVDGNSPAEKAIKLRTRDGGELSASPDDSGWFKLENVDFDNFIASQEARRKN